MAVDISLLNSKSPEYDLIRAYCMNTSESNNSNQIKKIRIFRIERKGEREAFEPVAAEIGNRKLLFHGSGLTNYLGLLSQGLRIAPPEAPPSGFMFGKGLYFADTLSKSLQYASGSKSKLILLCEVALGRERRL